MAEVITESVNRWAYRGETSPVFLNYVCVLNGHRPVPLEQPFTYCEIGCGAGVTSIGLAQLFPQASFTAVDPDPDLIEVARDLARAAGVENVSFHAANPADLDRLDGPAFDFIAVNGIYNWVDSAGRRAIDSFAGRRASDRAILSVGYDAQPGWSDIATMIEFMRHHTRNIAGDEVTRSSSGLDFFSILAEKKAAAFHDRPELDGFLEDVRAMTRADIAVEFFAPDRTGYFHHQVDDFLAAEGFTFSGSALLYLNFIDLAVPQEFKSILAEATTRRDFESAGDMIRNQRYRQDVFVKDWEELTEAEQTGLLADLVFGMSCRAGEFITEAQFGDVELKYQAELFTRIVDKISEGAVSARALSDQPELSGYPLELILDALKFLAAGGQVFPFAGETDHPSDGALASPRYEIPLKLNVELLKRRLMEGESLALFSTDAGIGLQLSMSDALYALCLAEAGRDEMANWVFQRLIESGREMVVEEGSELPEIEKSVEKFLAERLPKYVELGILKPV